MQDIQIGRVYRHFKGDYYLVEGVAQHSETGARFLRRSVMLRLADGSCAELACDCGVLHGKTEELPFAEVELESKEGAPDAAKALADRLAKQYNLRWEPLSKFARANALK